MDGRQSLEEKSKHHGALRTGVWLRYLVAGATLAITRVAWLMWLNDRQAPHTATQIEYRLFNWLWPELVVSVFWRSLVSSDYSLTNYYLIWGSIVTIGSFVLATPILFVRWLRERHLIVQIALCGLTIPAVTALLLAIVRVFGLDE